MRGIWQVDWRHWSNISTNSSTWYSGACKEGRCTRGCVACSIFLMLLEEMSGLRLLLQASHLKAIEKYNQLYNVTHTYSLNSLNERILENNDLKCLETFSLLTIYSYTFLNLVSYARTNYKYP